jgi:hypothetical protein
VRKRSRNLSGQDGVLFLNLQDRMYKTGRNQHNPYNQNELELLCRKTLAAGGLSNPPESQQQV